MKNLSSPENDGFGALVVAGIIFSVVQILSIVSFVVLALLWALTQDNSFGWALLWPVGLFVINMIAAMVFAGASTIKLSKEFDRF